MRKQYESKEDRDNERKVAEYVLKKFGTKLQKLDSKKYEVDFLAFKNGVPTGFVEYKKRKFEWHGGHSILVHTGDNKKMYDSVILSYRKYSKGINLAGVLGVDRPDKGRLENMFFMFMVEDMAGEIRGVPLSHRPRLKPKEGGRTVQTRDEFDVEQIIEIPVSWFGVIKNAGVAANG